MGEQERSKKCGFDDKLIIGFVGSFYPWHGIDFLLDAKKVEELLLYQSSLVIQFFQDKAILF